MATTISKYSEQATKIVSGDYEMLRPIDHYGRERSHFFNISSLGSIAAAAMCKLPAGARVLGGNVAAEGVILAGNLVFGLQAVDGSGYLDEAGTIPDADDFFGSLENDTASDASAAWGKSSDSNFGYVLEKACWLTAFSGGGFSDPIAGNVTIVVD